MTDNTYPWTRYCIPRGEAIRVEADGFVADPSGMYGRFSQPGCVELEALLEKPYVVLLGEAGIGKSHVMHSAATELRRRHGDQQVLTLDLGSYGQLSMLDADLFGSAEFQAWRSGSRHLWLLLDGLDEALAGMQNVVGLLVRKLGRLPFDRLRLWISCRTAAWPATLERHLEEKFECEPKDCVYEAVPLCRRDVVAAAVAEALDGEQFAEAIGERGLVGLAGNPLTLKMLLPEFRSSGGLTRSRAELFERGILRLCEEPRERRDRQTAESISKEQLLEASTRIAGLTLLSGHASVYVGTEMDPPPGSVALNDLGGELEGDRDHRLFLSEPALRAALKTGLFRGAGQDLLQFAHKSYAEFLAARFMQRSRIVPIQRRSTFYLTDEQPPRLVPQLHETAAWLAGMDREFFEELLAGEPEVLLGSDITAECPEVKAALVEGLLRRTQAVEFSYEQRRELKSHFGCLRYAGLADQLRELMRDRNNRIDTRTTALWIAEECKVKELGTEVADIVLDQTEDLELRISAGYVACDLDVPDVSARLKSLAFCDDEEDPEDQLRGLALRACWPASMTAEELFRALAPPRRKNFGGSYSGFLSRTDIVEGLANADLPVALAWAVEHGSSGDEGILADIAGRIATKAWQNMAEPGVLEPLARFVWERYRHHACPFFIRPDQPERPLTGNDLQAVRGMIERGAERRRQLLEAILKLPERQKDLIWLVHCDPPLARSDDFAWLLEGACDSPDAEARLWAGLARRLWNWSRVDHTEAWLTARGRSPVVAAVLNDPVKVDLASDDARKMKEEDREWQDARVQQRAPPLDPPPAERVRQAIEQCQQVPQRFSHLLLELTLKPDSTHYPLPPEDIRETPGWEGATPETRESITDAALRFLEHPPSDPGEYLSRLDGEAPISDMAAPQALLLLLHERANVLQRISPKVWRAWTHNILVQFARCFRCPDNERERICSLLVSHAPDEARLTVGLLIAMDAKRESEPRIIPIWEDHLDAQLVTSILTLLQANEFTPSAFAGVLGWLVRKGAEGAADIATKHLTGPAPPPGDDRSKSVFLAARVVTDCPDRFWTVAWPIFQTDPSWGREVVERICVEDGTHFFTRLSDEGSTDLAGWLLLAYPLETDPHHEGAFSPTGDDLARKLRTYLLKHLPGRGTLGVCAGLERLRVEFPQYQWLADMAVEANVARRRSVWRPPSPQDLRRMAANHRKRYVGTEADLLGAVMESLDRLKEKLQGELPEVRLLWNECSKSQWRPKDEEELSDHIARHLIHDLATAGVVINREVQIRRRAAAGGEPGQQTDIYISAVSPDHDDFSYKTVLLIAEVKGSWHKEVRTALKTQLVDRYLREGTAKHGLYIVGWYKSNAWDADHRSRSSPWPSIEAARICLEKQAADLTKTPTGQHVRAYVLDCSLR